MADTDKQLERVDKNIHVKVFIFNIQLIVWWDIICKILIKSLTATRTKKLGWGIEEQGHEKTQKGENNQLEKSFNWSNLLIAMIFWPLLELKRIADSCKSKPSSLMTVKMEVERYQVMRLIIG